LAQEEDHKIITWRLKNTKMLMTKDEDYQGNSVEELHYPA